MSDRDFEKMMDELTQAEIERLGVGSQLFAARHAEIMSDLEEMERSLIEDGIKKPAR